MLTCNLKSIYKNDYALGKQGESDVLSVIQKSFNSDIKVAEDKYAKFDFYDHDTLYELKTRRCKHNSYRTTFLPVHKVIQGKKQIFLFKYQDGLYYVENKNFDSYQQTDLLDTRFNQIVKHYEIPITDLTEIPIS